MILILAALLLSDSPVQLETEGRLAEAGAAWEAEGDLCGEARVMCRMLEEALYAGQGERALLLAHELEPVCTDTALIRYWRARAAWSAGLAELAADELDRVVSPDPWLTFRASGTAALYRGHGAQAADDFILSIASAGSSRRKFWSGIDLCTAYLSLGMNREALALSELLLYNYTGDDLAEVMYGLCLHASGNYSRAAAVLSGINGDNPAAKGLAQVLMEGFEQ